MGMINKFNLLHISEVDMRGFFLMPWLMVTMAALVEITA